MNPLRVFHNVFRSVFKVNPTNTRTHPFKRGTIDQRIYNSTILLNIIKDIPSAAVFSAIFAAYFTFWPYGVKHISDFVRNIPATEPQVSFENGQAVLTRPIRHVTLDKTDDE